jgi:hypothetical protein
MSDEPLAVYCPDCGAYLFVPDSEGVLECDQCGGAFEIIPPACHGAVPTDETPCSSLLQARGGSFEIT